MSNPNLNEDIKDNRLSDLFYTMIWNEYGIIDEDVTISIVGETVKHYYIQLLHARGMDYVVYDKENNSWQFIN